jgi:hypothetical protein
VAWLKTEKQMCVDEMGRTSMSNTWKLKITTKLYFHYLNGRDHSGDQGIGREMWTGFIWLRIPWVSLENTVGLQSSIKGKEFLDELSEC